MNSKKRYGFKICKDCGRVKLLEDFYRRGERYINRCTECYKEKIKEHYYQNRERILQRQKDTCDRVKIAEYGRQYRKLNKEVCDARRERYKERRNELKRSRWKKDIQFKLRGNLRARVHDALKGRYKAGSAVNDLGCSIDFLTAYLESKFYPNPDTGEAMSWENYTHKGWHIDHIKPLEEFDLSDVEQFRKAVHYSNLQPLWAKDNYLKQRKILVATSVARSQK